MVTSAALDEMPIDVREPEERRIAWGRHRKACVDRAQSRLQSRKRAGEAPDGVGNHAMAECLISREILVRIDDERADLRH